MSEIEIEFVCTGTSRRRLPHPSRLLGRAFVAADGTVRFEQGDPENTGARDARGRARHSGTYAKIDRETGEDYAEYRMVCPSCPTHISWRRAERAEPIARGAADEARTEGRRVAPFDVSKIGL